MLATATLTRLSAELAALSRQPPNGADSHRDRPGRRAQGAYFTPPPLVEFVVAETLRARLADPALAWRDDGSPQLRLLDPSAGDGRFLACAIATLAAAAQARGHDRDRAAQAIAARCAIGIERDAEFAALARDRVGATIHCREALLDPPDTAPCDVVIGNPPYVRSIRLVDSDPDLWAALRGRYAATSHGEWDLYAAFIEQALDWLAPGGHAGLVVPSRWLTAAFATGLRDKLARAGAVRAIVDFGAAQVFSGVTTYTSVVFLSRAPTPDIAVARQSQRGWHCGRIPVTSLSASPWRLSLGGDRALVERLTAGGPTLGDVARIVKGAGTNADAVYVIERAEQRGALVRGVSRATGAEVEVEAAACRPCIRGRDVRGYGAITGAVQCIVPYDRDGALWPPERVSRYPRVAAHLEQLRARLDAREAGRHAGDHYYRFGRPQNMKFFGDDRPKLVIPDVARGGRAALDRSAAMVLDSAYAIRLFGPAGYSLEVLLAVLNSPIVGFWLVQTGVPLRGGYMRLKTAYLKSLPLPPVSRLTADIDALVRDAPRPSPTQRARIDALVGRAYGIDHARWRDLS